MKRLTITYGGDILFDGEVVSMSWTDGADQVSVTGRLTTKPGLAELLSSAVKTNGAP